MLLSEFFGSGQGNDEAPELLFKSDVNGRIDPRVRS